MMTILWPIMGLCGAICVFLAGYSQGVRDGEQVIRAEWDTEKAAIVTAQREKESLLQANMDKLRTEKNNELARLNTTVRNLNASLRSRPERPAVPASAAVGDGAGGCTGATLYRSDSEFLIRLSERADKLRLALIQCQDAYLEASGK